MSYYDRDKTNAPATMQPAEPGQGSVGEFQVSGVPWLTGSVTASSGVTIGFDFQNVSKFVTLINHGSTGQFVRLGFTPAGVAGTKFIKVDGGQQLTLDVRVKSVFVRSDAGASPTFSLCAGLTMIPARLFPTLTGSSWSGIE